MRSYSATGTVLASQRLPEQFWPVGASAAVRITYQGVGYDGGGREVTGVVFFPATAVPRGGWPVVSYAHGTTGLADHCAPSQTGLSRLERQHVNRWLTAGYVVAATDYEGLATPGPHPYFNGEAVADDVVDIVRAARALDSRVSRTWLVAGFSQGGHAALFVGLMAGRYAPELDFRGTVALAPPVHLPLLISIVTADGNSQLSMFLPFLLAGLRTSHPDFDARAFLTDKGGHLVDVAATATLIEMFRAVASHTNDDTGVTGLHVRPEITPILQACRVPVAKMDRPVFLAAGTADEIVPMTVVERFAADLKQAGTTIQFTRHQGATHADMLSAGHEQAIAWAGQALAGALPPTTAPRRFSLFDANADGYLTLDDYEAFALRLVQAFGEAPGSPAALAVRAGYRTLWQAVAEQTDTNSDGRTSQAEFLRWIDATAADTGFDERIRPLAEAVILLADRDQDGLLDPAEFAGLLTACELPPERIAAELAMLDRDHDGSVSATEILDVIRRFCLKPTAGQPGHWLFGRF